MSVSVGNGFWDYLVFSNMGTDIKKIIATDVVDNPVDKEGIETLKTLGDWEFKKVEAEKILEEAFFNKVLDSIKVETARKLIKDYLC